MVWMVAPYVIICTYRPCGAPNVYRRTAVPSGMGPNGSGGVRRAPGFTGGPPPRAGAAPGAAATPAVPAASIALRDVMSLHLLNGGARQPLMPVSATPWTM